MENKLNIPQGDYSTGDANERACASVKIENSDILIVIGFDDDIQENSIVKICSDALNTYQSTVKLPSELAMENEKLQKIANHLLVNLEARVQGVEHKDWLKTFFKEEIEFLKSLTQ